MSSHAAPRRGWWKSLTTVPARLMMTAGILVGFGAIGTSAYWTDQATVESGSFTSGTLDLILSPTTALPSTAADPGFPTVGQGGEWTFAVLELADVAPGESVAKNIVFTNGGSTTLRFTGTAQTSSNGLSPYLKITTRPNANADNTGTKEAVTRAGTCAGGTSNWWTDKELNMTAVAVIENQTPDYVTLTPGAQLQVCMLVRFDKDAPSAYQGKTTTIKATFNAVQPNSSNS